jgi:hypothetical protein
MKKQYLEPNQETNDISNKKMHRRKGMPGGAKGKTTAIELMTPNQINGNGNNKGKKHCVYYKSGRTGIDAEDKGDAGKKLQKRQDYGDQVYGYLWKKIIPVDYFCKMCGLDDLVITRNEEYPSKQPAHNQFDPDVLKYVLQSMAQSDILLFPSPDSRL